MVSEGHGAFKKKIKNGENLLGWALSVFGSPNSALNGELDIVEATPCQFQEHAPVAAHGRDHVGISPDSGRLYEIDSFHLQARGIHSDFVERYRTICVSGSKPT